MKKTTSHVNGLVFCALLLFFFLPQSYKGQIDCIQKYAIENVTNCVVEVTYTLTCNSVPQAPVTLSISALSTYHVSSCGGGGGCDIAVQVNYVLSPIAYPQTGVVVDATNTSATYSNPPTVCAYLTGYGIVTRNSYVTQISYY